MRRYWCFYQTVQLLLGLGTIQGLFCKQTTRALLSDFVRAHVVVSELTFTELPWLRQEPGDEMAVTGALFD